MQQRLDRPLGHAAVAHGLPGDVAHPSLVAPSGSDDRTAAQPAGITCNKLRHLSSFLRLSFARPGVVVTLKVWQGLLVMLLSYNGLTKRHPVWPRRTIRQFIF